MTECDPIPRPPTPPRLTSSGAGGVDEKYAPELAAAVAADVVAEDADAVVVVVVDDSVGAGAAGSDGSRSGRIGNVLNGHVRTGRTASPPEVRSAKEEEGVLESADDGESPFSLVWRLNSGFGGRMSSSSSTCSILGGWRRTLDSRGVGATSESRTVSETVASEVADDGDTVGGDEDKDEDRRLDGSVDAVLVPWGPRNAGRA